MSNGWWDKLMKAPMTKPVESAEELAREVQLANERDEKLRKRIQCSRKGHEIDTSGSNQQILHRCLNCGEQIYVVPGWKPKKSTAMR